MNEYGRRLRAGFAVMVLTMSACASGDDGTLRPDQPKGYVVAGGSAIYAGSPLSPEVTRGGVDPLYFGQYVVHGLGARGGFSNDVGSSNPSKPEGAVIAIWWAGEVAGVAKDGFPEFKNGRPYYAAARPSQLVPYPTKAHGHIYYGIYVSAGRTVVSPEGLRPEDAPHATEFITGRAKRKNYVFGREDTVYYKILSRAPGSAGVEDDSSPWHTIPGVALAEAQYMELSMCNPATLTQAGSGKPCRAFLSIDDPDLTPEQREYVRQHPITRKDIQPLIREFKKAARISDRWA